MIYHFQYCNNLLTPCRIEYNDVIRFSVRLQGQRESVFFFLLCSSYQNIRKCLQNIVFDMCFETLEHIPNANGKSKFILF